MSSSEDDKPLPRPKPRDSKRSGARPSRPQAPNAELPVPAARRPREKPTQDTDPGRFEATIANQGATRPGADGKKTQHRYEVVRLIASGGMGEVWLARDRNFRDRFVALKRLKKEFRDDAAMCARFDSEAESLSRLVHIHTIRVFDFGRDNDGPFISMEFVSGPEQSSKSDWPANFPQKPLNLDEHVAQNGQYAPAIAVQVVRKLCRAVAEAHGLGIIHRDLKPANILLDANLEPKLIDFGLARDLRPEETQHTMAGSQLLTLGYGAPEQEVDSSQADHRADIYALGGILWFLISGQTPRFYRDSDVPTPLRQVLARCLERDRELRFQSVAELDAALGSLGAAVQDTPVPAVAAVSEDTVSELFRMSDALDGPRTSGNCPLCGHVHAPVPTSRKARQYCSGCGANLWLKCAKCDSKSSAFSLKSAPAIPLWDRFCSRCGDDLLSIAIQQLRDAGTTLQKARSINAEQIVEIREQATRTQSSLKNLAQTYGTEFDAGRIGDVVKAAHEELKRMHSSTVSVQSSNDEELWKRAGKINSLDAYKDYLKQFPKGQFVSQAEHRINVFNLAASVRQRLKDKTYQNLTRDVKQLIQWSPAVASDWPDTKLWALATRDGSPEACWAYLEIYPTGKGCPKAREIVSPDLRERLLKDMKNTATRETYLKYRSESDESEDESRAFNSTIVMSTALGTICAVPAGILGLAMPSAFWAAVLLPPAGLLIGLQLSFFSARYAKHGPLPRLSYLTPQALVTAIFRGKNSASEKSDSGMRDGTP